MYQYKVKITKYTEEGGLTNDIISKYADTPEQAKNICYEYDKQRYEIDDGEGNITTGGKMYRVELYILCYKLTDKDTFFAQFEV